jgi:putative DNA primase/helicase
MNPADLNRYRDALQAIPPDCDRGRWVKAGMAAHAAGLSFDDFDQWSANAQNYNARDSRDTWRSFKPNGNGVTAAALIGMARDAGWTDEGRAKPTPPVSRPLVQDRTLAPAMDPALIWSRCEAATHQHPAVMVKNAQDVPLDDLRVVPAGDPLRILGESMAGALVVPVTLDGAIKTLQFVTSGDTAERLKAKGKPTKLNLPGASLAGWHVVGKLVPGADVYLCEGIGSAWSAWRATGRAAVVCFGWGRVRAVAEALRQRDGDARLVLCPDSGKEGEAQAIAAAVGAAVAAMPEGWPANSDLHDLGERDGLDVVQRLIEDAKPLDAPKPELPLSVVFADELPAEFTPPDELVEGVLTVGDGSVLYGDSNSGKTFLVIDMACAVARGVPWMGRRTEPGLVIYLAAESPASVMGRLQAYQNHHGVRVPNFAIVKNPIDLFDGEADTDLLISVIKRIERERGQRVRLIVGDTLARLSAGANENAGQDMGLVIRRFDRIRTICQAHFMLIHHGGKVAAQGARGWSGLRAAVDTEIEVADAPGGRVAEITKQRDLGTKGQRVGFQLQVVTMGLTKWGTAATTCVAAPAEAPEKAIKQKRMGECEGAVLEFLAAHKVGIKKADVVTHFDGRYVKGPVYRAMKSLVEAQAIHEAAGMVCIATAAK